MQKPRGANKPDVIEGPPTKRQKRESPLMDCFRSPSRSKTVRGDCSRPAPPGCVGAGRATVLSAGRSLGLERVSAVHLD